MSSITSKLSSFLSGDIIFLLAIFLLLFVLSMYFGKGRFASVILAFYPATILFKSFPFMTNLMVMTGDKGILFNKIVIFLIFLIPVYLVINKYVSHYGEYGTGEGALRSGGYAAALLILIVTFSYTTVNFDLIHNFGSQIDAIFEGAGRIFWWNIAPLALLAFL